MQQSAFTKDTVVLKFIMEVVHCYYYKGFKHKSIEIQADVCRDPTKGQKRSKQRLKGIQTKVYGDPIKGVGIQSKAFRNRIKGL